MSARHHELAYELCKLVDAPNLLAYLGLESTASAESARAALRARRRRMQGMQSNPKHKKEALFLIKNLKYLEQVLADPAAHLRDVERRHESSHLPILRLTVQGVLKGGPPTNDQWQFLQRSANDLGVSYRTLCEVLVELCAELGVAMPDFVTLPPPKQVATQQHAPPQDPPKQEPPQPKASPGTSKGDNASKPTDPYRVLGVTPAMPQQELYRAYEANRSKASTLSGEAATQALARIEWAWGQIAASMARSAPVDTLSHSQVMRRSQLAPTAPPVRPRNLAPGSTQPFQMSHLLGHHKASLSIDGPTQRALVVHRRITSDTIVCRNTTEAPLIGRVSTDEGWLLAAPSRLTGEQIEQPITVRINPRNMFARQAQGHVTIQIDSGERVVVTYSVTKRSWKNRWTWWLTLLLVVLGLGLAASWLLQTLWVPPGKQLVITVDPTSEAVLFDGTRVGSGPRVVVDNPSAGSHTLTAIQANFESKTKTITIEPHRNQHVAFTLRLDDASLTFRPGPNLVRARLPQSAKDRVPVAGLNQCLQPSNHNQATVLLYIRKDGRTTGVEVLDAAHLSPGVASCLVRQGATASFDPLPAKTDYATLRVRVPSSH